MSTQHTPGPWRVVTDRRGDAMHVTSTDSVICSFLTSVKRNCGPGTIEANAKLITSAPDLLDALRQIADPRLATQDPVNIARAAIAKVQP